VETADDLNELEMLLAEELNQQEQDLNLPENVGTSKLTKEQVLEIKELLHEGIVFQSEIAEEYNVHQVTISKIKLGKIWRHI
jgi:predicted XRE-type DNA-binding protein